MSNSERGTSAGAARNEQQQQKFPPSSQSPDFLMPFLCQIAGHGVEGDGQRAFLKHADGRLLKPLQAPPKGARESGFYEKIAKSQDPTDVEIRSWLPRYFGVEKFTVNKAETEYIVLEDLTEKCELANVMDIKIGGVTYGPDASEKKRNHEDSKYAGTKKPLGFSVLGIIVNRRDGSGEAKKYDRNYGKNLKTEDAPDAARIFFDTASGFVRPLVEIVLSRLRGLLDVYKKQRNYLTFASSVLFVYDAAAVTRFLADSDRVALDASVNVKLIDFAHVFPNEDSVEDKNFTRGLKNLIRIIETLLEEGSREPSPKK